MKMSEIAVRRKRAVLVILGAALLLCALILAIADGGGKGPELKTNAERVKFLSSLGWEIDPVGFRATFRALWDRYHLPLLVTANGLGARDELGEDGMVHDDYRIDYLRRHIEQIRLALADGVDVLGYCPWSAIDLISTHQGFGKRYGFIHVNRGELDLMDMARSRKLSSYWYQEVIESQGASLDG